MRIPAYLGILVQILVKLMHKALFDNILSRFASKGSVVEFIQAVDIWCTSSIPAKELSRISTLLDITQCYILHTHLFVAHRSPRHISSRLWAYDS